MAEQIDLSSLTKFEEERNSDKDSDWFNFSEGANPMRILSNPTPLQTIMNGKKYIGAYYSGKQLAPGESFSTKWWVWIIDRKDNKIKIAKFGYKIVKQLQSLQTNPDYAFETLPMNYDIDINALNAGTKEVVYSMLPARKDLPLTEQELKEFGEKTPMKDIVDRMCKKQMEKDGVVQPVAEKTIEYPKGPSGDDIPF